MSQILFTGGSGPAPAGAVETLTGDTGGAVSPTANNINIAGGENINTVGNPGTSTITINLDETIHWPNTNGAGTEGVIYLNNVPFFYNYDGGDFSSIWLGGAGNFTNTASENIGIGDTNTLSAIGSGEANTALGVGCMTALVDGYNNVALGTFALQLLENGALDGDSSYNLAVGTNAGLNLLTGMCNVLIGSGFIASDEFNNVGKNYTSSESSNILIQNVGSPGESNVMRIGTSGTDTGQTDATYVAGIYGKTVDADTGTAVYVDDQGKLGTIVSSRRFKKDIESITEEESESIMRLRPVSFKMISEKNIGRQIGLIAEEVQEHIPSMVIHDPEGKPFTVKYHELPILMLNELQKQNAIITSLVRRINLLEQAQGGYDEL